MCLNLALYHAEIYSLGENLESNIDSKNHRPPIFSTDEYSWDSQALLPAPCIVFVHGAIHVACCILPGVVLQRWTRSLWECVSHDAISWFPISRDECPRYVVGIGFHLKIKTK